MKWDTKRVNETVYVEESFLHGYVSEISRKYESLWETYIFENSSWVDGCVEL